MTLHKRKWMIAGIILLFAFAAGCEYGTSASGKVYDQKTGLPIANARVMEFAVHKKDQEFLVDGYTDSLGQFYITNGMSGFGLKRTKFMLLIDKEGYFSKSVRNEGMELNIGLQAR